MTDAAKATLQRWVVSSLITFGTGFSIALLSVIDEITLETVKNGAIVGILFTAIRAGIKAVVEVIADKYQGSKA